MPSLKLQKLLSDRRHWDDQTWFQAERYILDNTSRPSMQLLLDIAGCAPRSGAELYFKTDAVKLLRKLPPRTVWHAWEVMRHRWRG
jgi:hypothetical protein